MIDCKAALHDVGLRLIPISMTDKKPAVKGFGRNSKSPPTWGHEPKIWEGKRLAILCGPQPNCLHANGRWLLGLDLDGDMTCAVLEQHLGTLPQTLSSRGGRHAYYWIPAESLGSPTRVIESDDGALDLRSAGTYCIETGNWDSHVDPERDLAAQIAALPARALAALQARTTRVAAEAGAGAMDALPTIRRTPTAAALASFAARSDGVPRGTNQLAGAFGGALARAGWSPTDAADLYARTVASPGRHVASVRRAVETVLRDGRDAHVAGVPTLVEMGVAWAWEPVLGEPTLGDLLRTDVAAVNDAAAPEGSHRTWRDAYPALSDLPAPPPLDYVIPSLGLARGQRPAAITCPPGVGKTCALVELCRAVVFGARAFGAHDVNGMGVAQRGEPGCALYLAAEARPATRRVLHTSVPGSAHARMHWAKAPPTFDAELLSWLAAAANDVDLIALDTLFALAPGVKENEANEIGRVMGALARAVEGKRACLVVARHAGKDEAKGGRGSNAVDAQTSVEWRLTARGALGTADRHVRWTIGRCNDIDAPLRPWAVRFDAGTWSPVAAPPAAVEAPAEPPPAPEALMKELGRALTWRKLHAAAERHGTPLTRWEAHEMCREAKAAKAAKAAAKAASKRRPRTL